jgi:hypothetical protein
MAATFKKIALAARCAGLSRDTLRRYERAGWVRPRRDWTGARIYSAEQIHLLRSIQRGEVDPRTLAGGHTSDRAGGQPDQPIPRSIVGAVTPRRQRGGAPHER